MMLREACRSRIEGMVVLAWLFVGGLAGCAGLSKDSDGGLLAGNPDNPSASTDSKVPRDGAAAGASPDIASGGAIDGVTTNADRDPVDAASVDSASVGAPQVDSAAGSTIPPEPRTSSFCPPSQVPTSSPPSGAKYVDPVKGDDAAAGSQAAPFRTLAHAFTTLRPGDTLVLRGGTYHESVLPLRVRATAEAPVTIRNYPGERPRIDASRPELARRGNEEWEPVDPKIHLYRSVRADYGGEIYVGKFEEGGRYYNLVPYMDQLSAKAQGLADLSALEENVSLGPRYVGPGLYNMAGRLYIRLTPSSKTSLHGRSFPLPSTPDPRQNALFVSGADNVIDVSGSYIRISGVDVVFGRVGIELQPSAHQIEISDLEISSPAVAVLLRNGTHHVTVRNVRVEGSFPPWVAWSDMKGGDGQSTPASHWTFRASGISGNKVSDIEVAHSCFDRVFDGSVMDGHGLSLHHNRYFVLDDMIQLGSSSYDVQINDNWIEGSGPSHNGDGTSLKPGTKYIHHNVILTSIDMLWGRHDPMKLLRPDYSGWHPPIPLPRHSVTLIGPGDPWKIYQNTILYDGSLLRWGMGYHMFGKVNTTGSPHEVYNNVFVEVGGGVLIDGLSTTGGSQIYDGNLYFRAVATPRPLFASVEDSTGLQNYQSLAAFRASRAFEESKVFIPTGWDSRSVEGDPRLDREMRPAAGGPAASGAIELPAELPGPRGAYRGALPPKP